jgi:predicted glycogen debranching enzyme
MPSTLKPARTSAPAVTSPLYSIETYGELQPYLSYEWLLTNGLGGFASSTVIGCNARRYHGLLVSATQPPVGRVMTLNRIGEILTVDGQNDRLLEFSINQFRQTFHPRGDRYLRRFQTDDLARWEYDVEGVKVTKELQIVWHRNVMGIRYHVEAAEGRPVRLQLLPFTGLRDFHALRLAGGAQFRVSASEREVHVEESGKGLFMQAESGRFEQRGDWWYGHTYAIETERGQDDTEDLYCPGAFIVDLTGKGGVTLWASCEATGLRDWDAELARRPKLAGSALEDGIFGERGAAGSRTIPSAKAEPTHVSRTMRRLLRAANDFIVRRKQSDGSPGTTVIAGYPWFADWGRDTMISLPGLFLAAGRFDEAGQVLSVFAQYVSEGMIPNVFDDYTNEPHYNTVDASLWFIHAAYEYLRLSHDAHTFEEKLLPACRSIIAGYKKGTRFKIGMDAADFLISAGDETTQLTWMDAKCGGIAFTPRQGKAVEINALWYNALRLMEMHRDADVVAQSFQKKFWLSPFRGCYDVVNGESRDGRLRPNQIFAVSLPHSPLTAEQGKSVVEVVRRELLTPYGLRTLARGDAEYKGRYAGDQMTRDASYHNGAVWPWLIGPFLDAFLRVNDRSPDAVRQARVWLQPLIDSMDRGCIGQIPEICEGDEPHRFVGCFAQAWSVAEVLRLAIELGM